MRRFCTGIQTNNQKLKKPCRVVKEKMETADRKKDFGLRMSEKQTYRMADVGCRRNRHIGYRMADVGETDISDIGWRMSEKQTYRISDGGCRI